MTDQEWSDRNLEDQRAQEATRQANREMSESSEFFRQQVNREAERQRFEHSAVAKAHNAP
jgi:hypothetical protein